MSAWDANWATTGAKGKIPLNALNQLRAALLERASVWPGGVTVPPALATGELLTPAWFATFHAAITTMVPLSASGPSRIWCNHNLSPTRNGGWDGAAWGSNGGMTVDMFTMPAMLATIGDAARVPVPIKGRLIGAWATQQYKIINQLRWIGFLAQDQLNANVWYKYGLSAIDFPTAAAIHDAMAWALVSTAPVPNNTRVACWQAYSAGGSHWKQSIKWKWTFNGWIPTAAEFDNYVQPFTLIGGPVYNMHTAGVGNYVQTTTINPSLGYEYGGTHALTPTFDNSIRFRGTSNDYGHWIIAKLDITNGFQYLDPFTPATTTTT